MEPAPSAVPDNATHGAVIKARLPLPGAVWDVVRVYEPSSRPTRSTSASAGATRRAGHAAREAHPIDAALGQGPTCLVVLFSKAPPGLDVDVNDRNHFESCAVLAVGRGQGPTLDLSPVEGHGIKTVDDFDHFAATRYLNCTAQGHALLGFVRFTAGHYVLLVTTREKAAVVGPHVLHEIRATNLHYLGELPKGHSVTRDEARYRDLFRLLDLSKGYFYSHTLDLTRRLPSIMTVVGLPKRDKFHWNAQLMTALDCIPGARDYAVTIIRGCVMHSVMEFGHRPVSVVLIARCSKKYAGARFLKRGVNDDGHVANHVEVEQILVDEKSLSPDRRIGTCSSFVQVRGSVPVFWGHENTRKPKPPMVFDRTDNDYRATKKHFAELMADYGAPIYVLNLLKKVERRPRETRLSMRYVEALENLKQDMEDPDAMLRYSEFDFRNRTDAVWNELTAVAEEALSVTGFFACDEHNGVTSLQRGVLRSNCVDCVDRTNYGQFFIGLHVFSHQLAAANVIPEPCAMAKLPLLREQLLKLYMGLGDHIGRQYGGSETVSAGLFARGVGWDKVMGIRRFYTNQFEDAEMQRATNLFLGLYTPCAHPDGLDDANFTIPFKYSLSGAQPGALASFKQRMMDLVGSKQAAEDLTRHVDIWDVENDYYLHVRHHHLPPVPEHDEAAYRRALSLRRSQQRRSQMRSLSQLHTPRPRTSRRGSTAVTPEPVARPLHLDPVADEPGATPTDPANTSSTAAAALAATGPDHDPHRASSAPAVDRHPLSPTKTPADEEEGTHASTKAAKDDAAAPAPATNLETSSAVGDDDYAAGPGGPRQRGPATPADGAAAVRTPAEGDDDDEIVALSNAQSPASPAEGGGSSSGQGGDEPAPAIVIGDSAVDDRQALRAPDSATSTAEGAEAFASPNPRNPAYLALPKATPDILSRTRPSTDADLGIRPFAVDPESSPKSPQYYRTRRSVRIDAVASPLKCSQSEAPAGHPTTTPPPGGSGDQSNGTGTAWFEDAVQRHVTMLSASVRQPESDAELALRRQQRPRYEHFASGVLLDGLPVRYVPIDFLTLDLEADAGSALTRQRPYTTSLEHSAVFPTECPPDENLLPEDPYDLILNPAHYIAELRKSEYLASELDLLDQSDQHHVIVPCKAFDYETAATSLVFSGPYSCWSVDEVQDALVTFQFALSEKPRFMPRLIADMRAVLIHCGAYSDAGQLLEPALERLVAGEIMPAPPRPAAGPGAAGVTTRPTRSGTSPPGALRSPRTSSVMAAAGGQPHVAMALSPRSRVSSLMAQQQQQKPTSDAATSSRHRAGSVAAPKKMPASIAEFLATRTAQEHAFLKDFHFYASRCPRPTDSAVYGDYVHKSERHVAAQVLTPFQPLATTLAVYADSVITSKEELDRIVRRWHDAMLDETTGVPRADLVRYAADLEVECPRAFAFRTVFTGGQLIDWILASEETLDVVLADSIARRAERENCATLFASCLMNAGMFHAISYTATVSGRTGIVTEPDRFKGSVDRRGLYRFLCHEPRHMFEAPSLPMELGMDSTDPQSILGSSYSLCRAALQWLYDDASNTPQQVRAVCEPLLPFVAQFNLSALSESDRACLFVNLFNTLFCLIFAYYRHQPEKCIDLEIAFHTHFLVVGGMHFSLADMKHGILRNNLPDPRMALRQFAPGDSRLRYCISKPDPRWMLLLLDLADDHEIEKLSSLQPIVPPKPTNPIAESSTSDDDDDEQTSRTQPKKKAQEHPPHHQSNRGALETATAATRQWGPANVVAGGGPRAGDGDERGVERMRRGSMIDGGDGKYAGTTTGVTAMATTNSSTSWWARLRVKRDEEYEVLRCSAVDHDAFESRTAEATRQVIHILSTAYKLKDGLQDKKALDKALLEAANTGLKQYASKVYATLKEFPELGKSATAVLACLRNLQQGSSGSS